MELNLIFPNIMSVGINQLMKISLNVVFVQEETVASLSRWNTTNASHNTSTHSGY